MESILNQLFWLWAPLSFLPEWLRIFLVLFVVLQIARPVLLKVAPFFLHWMSRLLKKFLYLLTYPVMAMISSIQESRRESGNEGPPSWVDTIEEIFAMCEKFFNKVTLMTKKRKRNNTRLKKWTFYAASAFAVLLTAAIVNNPDQWYSHKWKNAESWLAQKEQILSSPSKVPAAKITEPNLTEFVLNAPYKNGGNIREAPSLTARLLTTIAVGEAVRFLDEEQVDSKGLKWLKVETENGKIVGWISARIVREK